ncbi:MAG: SRPBCC family protein [Aureliella sp.]
MDFANPLGIACRVVKEVTHLGQQARVVAGSATFSIKLDELWIAVTTPDRLAQWLAPVSGELKLGGRYQMDGNAGGKIKQCTPPEAFEVTWEFGENTSWLRVQLDPIGDGTKLTLEHILSMDASSEEHWRKYGPGATGVGWELSFFALQCHIRTSGPVSQDDYNTWLMTDDGKAFIRSCSAAWANAHIAAGEEESTAKDMAEQTARFYCGE